MGQLSNLSFLQHIFQACSSPCKAPFYCKCLQNLPKVNLSVSVPWLLTWYLIWSCQDSVPQLYLLRLLFPSFGTSMPLPKLFVFFIPPPLPVLPTTRTLSLLIRALQASNPQAIVLSSTRDPDHIWHHGLEAHCRLQSDVCVRQPQSPGQLRALSVLVSQWMEVPGSRLLKCLHAVSWERPLLPMQTFHTTLEQGLEW